MEELSREEFLKQKEDASKRIREIYRGHTMPPFPDFVSVKKETVNPKLEKPPKLQNEKKDKGKPQSTPLNIFRFFNLPELMKSSDGMLILGLIFLLMSDKADDKLILALLFIML